jgi:hypothetical protein
MATTMTGGCLCGAVRYEVSADPVFSEHCYCRDCQRVTGAAMGSLMFVPKEGFRVTKGDLKFFAVTADSGNKVTRGFCGTCGSWVMGRGSGVPDIVEVTAGTLDDPNGFKPMASIFMTSAPGWAPVASDLPKFKRMPS